MSSGHPKIVKLLIEHHALYDSPDIQGKTPFQYAIEKGFVEVAKIFIENDVDVNGKDDLKKTPLHHAARLGYTYFILFLFYKNMAISNNCQ